MAFQIEHVACYPYNCRVTFKNLEDVLTARAWTDKYEIPCTWVGYALYISDRYADFLTMKYANATYN